MMPVTVSEPGAGPVWEATLMDDAVRLREALRALERVDPATARLVDALAFVLARVAQADGRVCEPETLRMEAILGEETGLTAEQALLVVEIAKHRVRMADCGSAYGVSRVLREGAEEELKGRVLRFLYAVGRADGVLSTAEERAIGLIASELGLTRDQ